MTKKAQLSKNKKPNPKRMARLELMAYKDYIIENCYGLCQLCGQIADDHHHAFYGSRGADKDDRYLIALCRNCHSECHKSKHGGLSTRAKNIAKTNWTEYNG